MRYINLQKQLQAIGWTAQIIDSDTRRNGVEKPASYVYAVRGTERKVLCTFSRLILMSRRRCAMMVAALPSLAQGECPNCGHAWNAHGSWIANPGDMTCEEQEVSA